MTGKLHLTIWLPPRPATVWAAARELMVKGANLSLDQAIETPRPGSRDRQER